MLRDASSRAKEAGARDVEEKAVEGAPIDALLTVADEVGADLIVVPADADDWPQLMYGSLGFRALGRRWQFTRRTGSA